MKKPEILKGEVLEYVDLVNHNYSITQTLGFYLHPFKPEMITEYFEGWEDINNNEIYSHQNSNNTYFTVVMRGASYDYYFKIYKNDNTELARHEFNNIQIIDNFISDCNRAGIKLTWKPEIVEKYFK